MRPWGVLSCDRSVNEGRRICELWTPKATYGQHLELFTGALGLSDAEKEAILSATSGRLWFGEG